jgi:hypothetical protein
LRFQSDISRKFTISNAPSAASILANNLHLSTQVIDRLLLFRKLHGQKEMDDDWSSLMGVNPRDLELNCNMYYDHDISTSLQASRSTSSNETQRDVNSWPITLAGPYLEMAVFDMDMSVQGGGSQDNGGVGVTGIRPRN